MLAHTLVGYRTTKYFGEVTGSASPKFYKKYNDAIEKNLEAIDGGSDFPDFLYACGKYSDHHSAAEAAHWPRKSSVPNFKEDKWNDETKKLVAFLFGVAVHYNADEIWEGLTDELQNGYGFIRALAIMNENSPGTSGALESPANFAADFYISYIYNLSNIKPWDRYFPLQDMVKVFHLTPKNSTNNYTDVTLQSLTNCRILFDLGCKLLWATKEFGNFVFHLYVAKIKQLPFVAENVLNYPIGGLDYMCLRANYVWQRIARWLDVGAPTIPPPRKNIIESDDDQDDRINHKVFQAMKEFLPYVENIKKLIKILEYKHSRVGNLFEFVDSNDVEKGIYFKGDADINISSEIEEVLCKILSKLILVKFSNTINIKIFKHRDEVPTSMMKPKQNKKLDHGSVSSIAQSNVGANAINATVGSENVGYLGHAIISGDFNVDGLIDIVYSAYGEGVKGSTPQSGNVYIFYGGAEHNGMKRSPQILDGDKLKQARFGWKLEVLDLNLDGIDDLVVSAPLSSFKNVEVPVPFDSDPHYRCYGKVHVYFGQNNTGLSNGNRITYFTNKSFSVLGSTLSKGDVDLDGNDDLIIGAPYSPSVNHTEPLTGSVYVVKASIATGKKYHTTSGNNRDIPIAYDISKIAYAIINGNSRYDLFGSALLVDNNRMYIGAPGHRVQRKTNTSDTVTVGCIYGYKLPLPQDVLPALQIIGNEILGEFGTGLTNKAGWFNICFEQY
eukprot:g99.t1